MKGWGYSYLYLTSFQSFILIHNNSPMTIPLQTLVIDTSPEVVFKAITDPNELTNWFPDNAILRAGSEEKSDSTSIKKDPKI